MLPNCSIARDLTRKMTFEVRQETSKRLELLVRNAHHTVMSAMRGVIMEESPSVRCERLFTAINQSVVRQEVLKQRLGQVHIALPAYHLRYEFERPDQGAVTGTTVAKRLVSPTSVYKSDSSFTNWRGHGVGLRPGCPPESTLLQELPTPCAHSTLVFDLDVTCTFNPERDCLEHNEVYSHDLVWRPIGDQSERFTLADIGIKRDVVLAHLAENQRIKIQVWAVKGIAMEHGKWSCANAHFRVVPDIQVHPAVLDEIRTLGSVMASSHARRLLASCNDKVFTVDPQDPSRLLIDATKCRLNDEYMRLKLDPTQNDAFDNDMVTIPLDEKHYMLFITSTDGQSPRDIFAHALRMIADTYRDVAESLFNK